MSDSIVAISRCAEYQQSKVAAILRRQFELLGGLASFVSPGDTVLIKPNFIAPVSRRSAAVTHPAVILEVARLLKDFGAKPFVGDSPAWANAQACVKRLKLDEPLKKLGVPVRQLNKPVKCRIGADNTNVNISSVALNADAIINLPKFKMHQQMVATFAVKNMFGCVSGKQKAIWHFAKGKELEVFSEFLIDIYRFLNPVLTIVDGIVAMEGLGPIRGEAKEFGWLIASKEPIACETVCAKLAKLAPEALPIVRTARKMGFGCSEMEKIKVVSDDFADGFSVDELAVDFEQPEPIPVRFSLFHISRSVLRQIILVIKSRMKPKNPKNL